MEEFVLIMRHEDGKKVASPEQIQAWMKQTMDWIGGIAAQNKFSSGTGLPFEDARVVRPNNIGNLTGILKFTLKQKCILIR